MATSLTKLILEKLSELGEVSIGSFFPAKYPQARMWRDMLGNRDYEFSRRTFSSILSRLQSHGLVERHGSSRNSVWRLAPPGERYLQKHRSVRQESDGIRRLVIFDIPEKRSAYRNAIRAELVACGYRKLQKSVWIGTAPLPLDFAQMLDNYRLTSYVHIFSIRDTGTL